MINKKIYIFQIIDSVRLKYLFSERWQYDEQNKLSADVVAVQALQLHAAASKQFIKMPKSILTE